MAEPTTLFPEFDVSTLEAFNCDSVELKVHFEPGEFNLDEFIARLAERGITARPDQDGDTQVLLSFGNQESEPQYHAHLMFTIWKNQSGVLDLDYFPGTSEGSIEPPPSAADCSKWLGSFFNTEVRIHIHLDYTFNQSFSPRLVLNFPLPTSDKALAGSVVSGLALIIPGDERTTAILQSGEENQTHVFIRKSRRQHLKDFYVFDELERTTGLIDSLISKSSNAG
jgi:hypothetical protein